ncbi:MAG: hypothetical protein OHK0039_42850 [Bacteroidia bacterium]
MKPVVLCLLLCAALSPVLAQKTQRSEGAYQLRMTGTALNEEEACRRCEELAMIEAIEKAFGRVVIQGNTSSLQNIQTGETVETTQVFNMIAETYVNGEWIKTLDESCERFTHEGEFWLRCSVKGVVQELEQARLDLVVKPLDCEELRCETFQFQDGESFYLYLQSPIDGYITIYLADAATAQRLLPYREMPATMINGVAVKADQPYILFSHDKDRLGLRGYIDEYELFAASPVDQNRLFVVFSREPLVKPALRAADGNMPMELVAEEFHRWLAHQKQYNRDIQVARVDLSIIRR